jgi:tRNA uridine 5-carboxymethylaminomethyl modification enzyme
MMESVPVIQEKLELQGLSHAKVIEQAEVTLKYEGYIQKENELVERVNKLENLFLKEDFNYAGMPSLSTEARQKLSQIKPRTLGQASRISGVSPSDISALMVYLRN